MSKKIIKSIFFTCTILFISCGNLSAQDTRKTVAVVPATGEEVRQSIKDGITEGLLEGVVKSRQYRPVARDQDFVKALSEMTFQQGGAVADDQLIRFGRALGASLVCFASVNQFSDMEYRITYKMIDVASGEILDMSSETVRTGVSGLLNATDNIAKRLFGDGISSSPLGGAGDGKGGNRRNGSVYNPDGIELVYVEGTGSGIMAMKGFYIGKFEVTQAQWQAIMGDNPSSFRGAVNLPVESVNWNDLQEFLARLNRATGRNYRLPTEAEWEFAARGGTAEKFCLGGCDYSGSNDINSVAWFSDNSGSRTQPVGTKEPNELGIHDMSGNVLEWCEGHRARGGSWEHSASNCVVASGGYISYGARLNIVGFRVVLP